MRRDATPPSNQVLRKFQHGDDMDLASSLVQLNKAATLEMRGTFPSPLDQRLYYLWIRALPPLAKFSTCSAVAIVVSPGKVVSKAPCAQPRFTASCGETPFNKP